MGAYSTLRITRSTAQNLALRAVLNATDELLEAVLAIALEPGLRNAAIVGDGADNDDDEAMAVMT